MPFIDFLVRNSMENPAVPISSPEVMKVLGGSIDSGSGVDVNERSVLGISAVWRLINTITSDIAKLPLDVLRRKEGGKVRATDHPAYFLLRRKPNPWTIPFRFKKTLFLHAIFRGNGYSGIFRDNGGRPRGLTHLPPTPITYPVKESGQLWYVTIIDGRQHRIPAEDVIHIPGLAFDGFEGLDVLTVLANVFGLEIAQHAHAEDFFAHGTQSAGFLTAPKRLGPEEVKDLRQNWAKMQTGMGKMHNVAVLHGELGFTALGIDPIKAQLLQSRELGLVEIANVFCAPPHKAGHPARTSYNSLEMENADYLSTTLDPWLRTGEEEFSDKLLTEDEKRADEISIEFNRNAILRVAYAERIAGYAKLKETGNMNANQIAARENLPSQGLKGEQFYIPANWAMVGPDGAPILPRRPEGEGATNESPTGEVVAAHRSLIADRVEQLIRFEIRNVHRAAEKEQNFLVWMDGFYRQHQAKLQEAIEPAVNAFYAVGHRTGASFTAFTAARVYTEQSRRDLLAVADTATQATLADEVRRVTEQWIQRAEQLAGWVVEN